MKKIKIILLVILLLLLGVAFCYLLYKVWNIFGFWTLMWTGSLSTIVSVWLGQLIGSRVEKNGVITYNPKEWPKLISILSSIAIGYYLYTIINNPNILSSDRNFGIAYLLLLTAIPIIIAIYKIIRDRNDFISIDGNVLKYKDNLEIGEFEITSLANVELSGGIKLTFKDNTSVVIKTGNMNFNAKDLVNAFNDIKAQLPLEKIGH
jgi:hypothetical protein